VITASLYARLRSRGNGDFADRVLAALRNQFGGHAVHSAQATPARDGKAPTGRGAGGPASAGNRRPSAGRSAVKAGVTAGKAAVRTGRAGTPARGKRGG
jgi:hypothetical protein